MLADVAEKRDQLQRTEPVGVVDDARRVARRVEIEEPLELRADAFQVGVNLFDGEQRPFLRLSAGIADQSGAAADERDRGMSGALQAREEENRQQRSDVQAR